MADKVYMGVDNGTTGTIGVIGLKDAMVFFPFTKKELDYHKKAKNITRIDFPRMRACFLDFKNAAKEAGKELYVIIERPFTGMAHTAVLAGRTLESMLIALELESIPYEIVTATDWMGTKAKEGMLPKGIVGRANVKRASVQVGCRLFPELADQIRKHKDADGILIAEWARRSGL